ncbi:SMI1/KNR4 family protein [Priestia filamentosa]|uniref:SMI1/KNR4 family protein n=1 Tax=Priestia filamentosa TaxID=1402861 RepID=UPI001FB3E497|nr:SMI1/KNR4 family protein [Priestia filamentosa]UOE62050.1 SMI1/KNR4 family protein [Priestia filamentosa]
MNALMKDLEQEMTPLFSSFLNPPASKEKIKEVEKEIGVTFPSELRQLYLYSDGEGENGPGFFFGLPFLSLDGLLEEWRVWKSIGTDLNEEIDSYSVPTGWIEELYTNSKWIPISKDFGGNNMGVDLSPDVQGMKGQVINFGRDEETKYVIAQSLNDFLRFMLKTIRSGNYTIYNEDDTVSWSYGDSGGDHFFDELSDMSLPVLRPQFASTSPNELEKWYSSLNSSWREIVDETSLSPQQFIKSKQLYFLRGPKVNDLSPLSLCTEMKELILSGNNVKDLSPLARMNGLKKLFLAHTPVEDVRSISHLQHLKELNVSATALKDLSQLASFPVLKTLHLKEMGHLNYSGLSQLSIQSLFVSIENGEHLHALSKIKTLKHLSISSLQNVKQEEIAVLEQLTNLQTLEISEGSFLHLDFMKKMKKLKQLTFSDCVVKDAEALATLPQLKDLELRGSEIVNLEKIARSSSLTKFSGSFQQFNLLKDLFSQKVDFSTLIGETSAEEEDIWHHYLNEQRK